MSARTGSGWTRGLIGAVLVIALWASAVGSAPASAPASPAPCPHGPEACLDALVVEMERSYEELGCDHNAAFALLYWRTTEGIRAAIRAGEFSDVPFWSEVTTAFGRYYLDAFQAWRDGPSSGAPKPWRMAFQDARQKRVPTLGDVYLGINAHVNYDLAFVYHRLGATDYEDHLHVNTVLTRTRPVAYPQIAAELDPTVTSQRPNDPTLSLDVFAWRELAWENARRLDDAPDEKARRKVAADIERHAVETARRIQAAFPATRETTAARDAHCARVRGSG